MNTFTKILIIIFLIPLEAQMINRYGTTAANFLEIGVGSDGNAMGEAFVAVTDGISSIYWNPAGLSWVGSLQISFNHADWLANTDLENVSMVIPINVNKYSPLSGSFAKEWTLSIIPDLTMNAPKRLNEKTEIASRIVQTLR